MEAIIPAEGTHEGCPYRVVEGRPQGGDSSLGLTRAPTRGAPTGWGKVDQKGDNSVWAAKGTHKGCPYGVGEWRPKGGDSLFGLTRAPTRGAPTGWGKAIAGGDSSLGAAKGTPQGVPLRVGGRATSGGGQFVWLTWAPKKG